MKMMVEMTVCDHCNTTILNGGQLVRAMLGDGKNIEFFGRFFLSVGPDDHREYKDLCPECLTSVVENACFGSKGDSL